VTKEVKERLKRAVEEVKVEFEQGRIIAAGDPTATAMRVVEAFGAMQAYKRVLELSYEELKDE